MINSIKNLSYKAAGVTTATIGGMLASGAKVFADDPECDVTAGQIQKGADCAKPTGTPSDLFGGTDSIFSTISNTLLFLVGAISVIMLIFGGIRYVVSAGDQNAVTGAKNTILYAIVGIIVSFLAYAAVNFVTGQLTTE